MNRRCAYYTVNDNELFLFLVMESVRSLRRYNASIPVRVFISGHCPAESKEIFRNLRVDVTELPAATGKLTFLKWWALPHLNAERNLFVDADTVFYGDVDQLFERYAKCDFYAREEHETAIDVGTEIFEFSPPMGFRDLPFGVATMKAVGSIIDAEIMQKVTTQLGVERIPVFNTGLMLFNHGSHTAVAERLPQFRSLIEDFRTTKLPYPSTNRHVVDEIVTSLVMAGMPDFSYGLLSAADAPFYMELRARRCSTPGIVMHMFSACYPDYVKYHGSETQQADHRRHDGAPRTRLKFFKLRVTARATTCRATVKKYRRLRRARSRLRAGAYAEAAALAEEIAAERVLYADPRRRSVLYRVVLPGAAQILSQAIAVASRDSSLETDEQARRTGEYTAVAVGILEDLRRVGHLRAEGLERLLAAALMQPLRGRDECQQLLHRWQSER